MHTHHVIYACLSYFPRCYVELLHYKSHPVRIRRNILLFIMIKYGLRSTDYHPYARSSEVSITCREKRYLTVNDTTGTT